MCPNKFLTGAQGQKCRSWIRITYSSVSDFSINKYLDEFCYRINRSQRKE